MSYDALFARRAAGIRLGLEAVQPVFEALGRPGATADAIHVVGTNGKGSVAAMCEHALRGRGVRVGLFTSPHLCRVTERVRVGGVEVGDDVLQRAIARVLGHEREAPRPLTFFEVITLAALVAFADAGAQAVVAEAGLGGRLDATRLVAARVVAVSRIALDHQAILGDTLGAIAAEKAAVFRRGVTAWTVPQLPTAMAALRASAHRRGCGLLQTVALHRAPIGLPGAHQAENGALAVAAVRALIPEAGPSDLDGVRWPARLETLVVGEGRVVLDAAHNPDGVAALCRHLAHHRPDAIAFGCYADRDVGSMVRSLTDLGVPLWWVGAPGDRRPAPAPSGCESLPDVAALVARLAARTAAGDTVVVAGAHTLVGAVRAHLTGQASTVQPSDPGFLAGARRAR